jgi:tetratricopeptide (TPR) repeat protein
MVNSAYSSLDKRCNDKNLSLAWNEIKQICEKNIEFATLQNDIKTIGQVYFQYSKLAYINKEYIFAENLLYLLKREIPSYLLEIDNNYHWHYLIGKIKLRNSLYKDAILNFQESLNIAESMDKSIKNKLISYSLNMLGLSYSKTLHYEKALSSYRKSLSYKERFDLPLGIAKTLNNIANVYDLLEDHKNALHYYLEARDKFSMVKNNAKAQSNLSHCYGNIGIVYNKLNKPKLSIASFNTALKLSVEENHNHEKLNIYTYLANSYLKIDNNELAIKYYQLAIQEETYTKQPNAFLRYELASYYFNNKEFEKALNYLSEGIQITQINEDRVLPKLYYLQSKIYKQQNNLTKAIDSLLAYNSLREKFLENKFNQDIRNISYQIEIEKNQFDVKLLKKDNLLKATKINRQYWIIFSIILTMLVGWILLRRVLKEKTQERNNLLKKIDNHKQKIIKMEGSKNQLKQIFKETSDAILCIDSGWVIAFHNNKFNEVYGTSLTKIDNQKIETVLPDFFEIISQLPLDENDMLHSCEIKQLPKSIKYTKPNANIRINTINLLDDYTVFSIGENKNSPYKNKKMRNKKQSTIELILGNVAEYEQFDDHILEILSNELNKNIYSEILYSNAEKKYRNTLVELMNECVDVWFSHTNSNRIELADASGYWKISIDDGRLRTRAMDRYLHIKQLPKKPRWRLVVKTAHYILSECNLHSAQRNKLSTHLDEFLIIVNNMA